MTTPEDDTAAPDPTPETETDGADAPGISGAVPEPSSGARAEPSVDGGPRPAGSRVPAEGDSDVLVAEGAGGARPAVPDADAPEPASAAEEQDFSSASSEDPAEGQVGAQTADAGDSEDSLDDYSVEAGDSDGSVEPRSSDSESEGQVETAPATDAGDHEGSADDHTADAGDGEGQVEAQTADAGDLEGSVDGHTAGSGDGESPVETTQTADAGGNEGSVDDHTAEAGDGAGQVETSPATGAGDLEGSVDDHTAAAGDTEGAVDLQTADAGGGEGSLDDQAAEEGGGEGSLDDQAAEEGVGEGSLGDEAANAGESDFAGGEPVGSAGPPEADEAAAAETEPAAAGSEETVGGQTPTPAEGAEPEAAEPLAPRPPSAHPVPSMLGSGLESRSWLLELPEFEGPLDLLLHLVRRHELDILDIPTSFVTEKYLEYLAFMEAMDLEVAGDYLVMAATLAYLKSRELVPTEPSEEDEVAVSDTEGPDPREELIARLLEYQKFRAAASDLDKLPVSGRDVFSRGGEVELPPVDPGLAPLTLFRLAEAYHRVLDRARIHKSHDVVIETCSVAQRMHQLTSILIESSKVDFESLFLGRSWSSEAELRSMLVVTLMSVLELTKLGVIFVRQEVGGDTILLERKSTPEEAKRAIAGYDESISFGAPKPGVAEDPESGEGPDSPPAAGAETPREDAESNSDA